MSRYHRYDYERGYRDGYRDTYGAVSESSSGDRLLAHLTYGLYVCGFFTGALTTVLGLILAYVARDRRDPFTAGHYSFLIDTFWSALLAFILIGGLAIILAITVVGLPFAALLWIGLWIWYVLRIARGWIGLINGDSAPI